VNVGPISASAPRGFLWHVAPTWAYVVALFWLGSIHTTLTIPQDLFSRDKANHFVAFGLLTLLFLRTLRFKFSTVVPQRLVLAAILVSSATGALLEVWQLLFPYRSSEVQDWVADTLGAILAGLTALVWLWWRARRVAMGEPRS
jgi:VanZ family protein